MQVQKLYAQNTPCNSYYDPDKEAPTKALFPLDRNVIVKLHDPDMLYNMYTERRSASETAIEFALLSF